MKTICYDHTSLNKASLELKRCPYCHSVVQTRETEPSAASHAFQQRASKPVVSTHLSECSQCAWWLVREQRLDHELYVPLLEDLIVMEAFQKDPLKPRKTSDKAGTAPWEQVLSDTSYWANAEPTPPVEAVQLFGTAQMLLPNMGSGFKKGVFAKLKSLAPVLIPILIIILIGLIGTFR
ncbi:MAG: hypothetical protein Q9M23_00605 [Mariprofundaceae bacterium]|nr:hypothetical protein [Mariprofundaceae bacterium]